MTSSLGFHLVTLITVFLIHGAVSNDMECRDAVAPPTKPRGVNLIGRLSNSPIFSLHLVPLKLESRKRSSPISYKVSVDIKKGFPIHMMEATLSLSVNGSCGTGDFEFFPGDYDDILQEDEDKCPRLLHTRHSKSMTQLPSLIWTPPDCGCVKIRALIRDSSDAHYAENKGVSKGHLATTMCLDQRTINHKMISRKRRMESLCHVIDKHTSSEIITSAQFLRHRDLDHRHLDRFGLEMAMEVRRSEAMTCCSMVIDVDKMRCFDAARKRRIDDLCADGSPDIPFRRFRKKLMRKLEQTCCFILGEDRYSCFDKNIDSTYRVESDSIYDYSIDASDPVNDLADFGSREHLDEFLRPIGLPGGIYETLGSEDKNTDGEISDEEKSNEVGSINLHQVSEVVNVGAAGGEDELPQTTVTVLSTSAPRTILPTARRPTSPNLRKAYQEINSLKKSKRQRKKSKSLRQRHAGGSSKIRNPKVRRRDGMESFSKSSAERRKRKYRGGRRPMKLEDVTNLRNNEHEDQGGSSKSWTMTKLNKKLRRLGFKKKCCTAGGDLGGQVYGAIHQVTDECKHGGLKFVKTIKTKRKSRKLCKTQFVLCCSEEAKKGLTMTSQEFMETSILNSWDNRNQYDSELFDKVLSQRGENTKARENRRFNTNRLAINKVLTNEDSEWKLDQNQEKQFLNNRDIGIPPVAKNALAKANGRLKSTTNGIILNNGNQLLDAKRIGSLDSREMAEIHKQSYKEALESRKMADQRPKLGRRSRRRRTRFGRRI